MSGVVCDRINQRTGLQDDSKTSNGVQSGDMGGEEGA